MTFDGAYSNKNIFGKNIVLEKLAIQEKMSKEINIQQK